MSTEPQNWKDIFYTSRDGLRLYGRHYPAPGSTRRPLLCLPGLTRNSRDFHLLASLLSDPRGHRREVFAVDYRGRGRSEHDDDWRNYTPYTESLDVLDFITLAGISDAAVVGTSRGGLIAMILACLRPTAIGALVFNDIGPVTEKEGLARLIGFVGRMPLPATWDEATALVRDISKRAFPDIPDAEWLEVARQWYNDDNGLPGQSYDRRLSKSLSMSDLQQMTPMWTQFDALARLPMLALRGENSDILSVRTLEEMRVRHQGLKTITVAGQGHAPLLRDRPTIAAIQTFLMETDFGAQAQFHGLSAVA